MHILQQIVRYKKQEVIKAKLEYPVEQLQETEHYARICNSYIEHLNGIHASGVIAEFKRKSPSKQSINLSADITKIVKGYETAGVGAISILTDEHFFGGNNQYLKEARRTLPTMPLLRKDFIVDEYQIIEAKSIGADIVLLICEILTDSEIRKMAVLARSLGMEVLLELHSADQVSKYNELVTMVGVNNRDLNTFEVDYERSKRLFDALPSEVPKIAESGLSEWQTLVMLYKYGFRGFLIGEQFMKQKNPGAASREFIQNYMDYRSVS